MVIEVRTVGNLSGAENGRQDSRSSQGAGIFFFLDVGAVREMFMS